MSDYLRGCWYSFILGSALLVHVRPGQSVSLLVGALQSRVSVTYRRMGLPASLEVHTYILNREINTSKDSEVTSTC